MARIFLAVVGAAYIALAIWCAARPDATANAVGFELISGSGQSEFFVVYGGLELALGIAFLWPLRRAEDTVGALRLCCLVHSCLVVFRTVSFFQFSGISTTTYALATVEWLILLGTLFIASKAAMQPASEQQPS
tara:strand:- start:39743 stop:40144 length:402 start_codon:yes stop_codon:yes gene_type:complete